MDFATLNAAEVAALQGPEREAYYAWRTNRPEKLREVIEANGLDVRVEAPEIPRDPTVETATTTRRPGRPRGA